MRVGFLEVVQRAEGRVLPQLPQSAFTFQVVADAVAIVGGGLGQEAGHRLLLAERRDVSPEGPEERLLQVAPHRQQRGSPFAVVVHAVEPLIVQLVQHVEG